MESEFIHFMDSLHDVNPVIMEAVKSGYVAILEAFDAGRYRLLGKEELTHVCDFCHKKEISICYVVEDRETGDIKRFGSSCIKKALGLSSSEVKDMVLKEYYRAEQRWLQANRHASRDLEDAAINQLRKQYGLTPKSTGLTNSGRDEIEKSFQNANIVLMEGSETTIKKWLVPHIDGKSPIKTDIPPEERELDNRPKYSTGKAKVNFRDWLGFNDSSGSVAKASNGKWYGWSHRAVYGFGIGDKVKKGDCAYVDHAYTIKTEDQAKKTAEQFADSVS